MMDYLYGSNVFLKICIYVSLQPWYGACGASPDLLLVSLCLRLNKYFLFAFILCTWHPGSISSFSWNYLEKVLNWVWSSLYNEWMKNFSYVWKTHSKGSYYYNLSSWSSLVSCLHTVKNWSYFFFLDLSLEIV